MDFDDLYLVWKLMTWGLRIYTCFVDIVSFRAKKREKTVLKILPRIAIFLVLTVRTKCPFLKLCLDGFWWSIPCLKAYDLGIKNIHLFCWYCIIKGKKREKTVLKILPRIAIFLVLTARTKCSFLKLCLDGFWWSIPCLKAYDLGIKNIHLFCWYCII